MPRSTLYVSALFFLLAGTAGGSEISVQPLRGMDSNQLSGYSMLVRKADGLFARLDVPGSAAAEKEVWWLVFNNPAACSSAPCTLRDLFDARTRADLIRGRVDTQRVTEFCLDAGKAGTSMMPRLGFEAAGLVDADKAEVHVMVADGRRGLETLLRRELAGFGGQCGPGKDCDGLKRAIHRAREVVAPAI